MIEVPRRMWLIARSSTWLAYPCRCAEQGGRGCGKDSPWGCPCWGRFDLANVPGDCCARRRLATLTALAVRARDEHLTYQQVWP